MKNKLGLYIVIILIIIALIVILGLLFKNFQSPAKVDITEQIFNPSTNSPTNIHLENLNLHQDLPNKFYNPSFISFEKNNYNIDILCGKLTSFSKCKETKERSQYIYDTIPGDHSSNIAMIVTLTPKNYNDINNTREKLFFTFILDIPITKDHISHSFPVGYEDPRIFMFNRNYPAEKEINDEGIYIMCNARLNSALGKSRMFLLYLGMPDDFYALTQPNSHISSLWLTSCYKLSSPDINSTLRDEKNWSPWWCNGKLNVTYSILPHVVLNIPIEQLQSTKNKDRYNKFYGELVCKKLLNLSNFDKEIKSLIVKPNYSSIVKKALTTDVSLLRCSTIGLPYSTHYFLAFGHIRDGDKYWTFPYVGSYVNKDMYTISMLGEPRKIIDSNKSVYVSGLSQNNDPLYPFTLHFGIDDCTYGSKSFSDAEVREWLRAGTDFEHESKIGRFIGLLR